MPHIDSNHVNPLQSPQPQETEKNLLHFKPVSAHLFSGIRFVGTSLHRAASPNRFHGHLVRALSKTIVVTGYVLNTIVALVEGIASLQLAALASILHAITKARYPLLQKHTVKCWAYSFNSLALAIAQIYLIVKRMFPTHHFANAFVNHAFYLGSAFAAQGIGYAFDGMVGRNPTQPEAASPTRARLFGLFTQNLRSLLTDIINGVGRDLSLRRNRINPPNIDAFFTQHQEHAQTLREFGVNSFNRAYMTRISRFFADLLRETLGVDNNFIRFENATTLVINKNKEIDVAYQNSLSDNIKRAFIEIHNTPRLAGFLGAQEQDAESPEAIVRGKAALMDSDYEMFVPLAYYAQFKELEQPIRCPEQFGNKELNDDVNIKRRHQNLINAKALIEALNPSEKELLIAKLLLGASYEKMTVTKDTPLTPEITKAYCAISELGEQLHRGKLVSLQTIDTADLSASCILLFQKALEEANAELTKTENESPAETVT